MQLYEVLSIESQNGSSVLNRKCQYVLIRHSPIVLLSVTRRENIMAQRSQSLHDG
jgi:hypothetical protein